MNQIKNVNMLNELMKINIQLSVLMNLAMRSDDDKMAIAIGDIIETLLKATDICEVPE